ncbi:hypothetical protein NUACC21_40350 [Scytonema sp. NUACC21]
MMQQLSIGNIVNLGLYLYRSRLKLYFKLALTAHLWLLIPIYGLAKFYTIAGLMSRLAFQDLVGNSENLQSAKSRVNRQIWNFLFTGILVNIIVFIFFILFYLLLSLIAGLIFFIITLSSGGLLRINSTYPFGNWLFAIILVPTVIIIYLSPFWFYSWLFVTDLPLVVEKKVNSFKAIGKSWQLTKGYIRRVLGTIFISILITLPVLTVSWFVCSLLLGGVLGIFFQSFLQQPDNDSLIGTLILVSINTVSGLFTMPFWQAVKAAMYYDILCRKEGFDLKLSNSTSQEQLELESEF